ncbi:glycosyltransferase family 9 protein [Melioribacteraceae bacterium 4301-Me]|uniref:glycosyltransferase family 9 protein n=1 Tax=Pyranulibacter aquaticus TaxID=3163344 RepID=UPI0035988F77
MTKYNNILIVRTDRIGDVVLTLPLVTLIKKHYPNSKITFLLREYTKSLTQNNPFIDKTITLKNEDKKYLFGFLGKVIANVKQLKNKYDVCIVASPSFLIALVIFLSKIKVRIGTAYRWYSFFFNKKIYEHRKYGQRHELEFNVRMLKSIGIDENINENNVSFNLHVTKKSEQFVENLLNEIPVKQNEKMIICHPGSGGSAVDLPIGKFKELIELLVHNMIVDIILITGSKNEESLCNQLVINQKTKNLAGQTNLEEMIALINKAELVISNSTGPIHLAAALGKKVVGFYPNIISCSPKRWGPYTTKKLIFTPEINCKKCTLAQCKKLNCMESINIEKVFLSISNFLKN